MSRVMSKIGKSGFARFLVFYLCLGLATPATPLLAAMGDISDNSGYILFDQAFFAFEVESPLDTLKGVPTWDELEHILDNPYAFELDNVNLAVHPNGPFPTSIDNLTGRPSVENTTGAFFGAGTGNDQGWPSYRRTDSRRRVVQYRAADNVTPAASPPGPSAQLQLPGRGRATAAEHRIRGGGFRRPGRSPADRATDYLRLHL